MLRAVASTIRSTSSAPARPGTADRPAASRRATAAVAGIASAVALLAAGSSAQAITPVDSSEVVERGIAHEVVGTVTMPGEINLAYGLPLRVGGPDDRWMLQEWMSEGTDGVLATQVVDLIDSQYPNHVPSDTVLLIGLVHTGCLAPESITVATDAGGRVRLGAVPDPQEAATLCEVVEPTVAVVAVAAEDAIAGSADGAELVAYQRVDYGAIPSVTAVDLTGLDPATVEAALATIVPVNQPATDVAALADLPPLADGHQRLAFLRPGCLHDTAELLITPAFINATLELTPEGQDADCAVANYFVTIFDVPGNELPSTAVLVGA